MTHAMTAMPKYENYKNSGEGWIGDIPLHWKVEKLKYLFYEKKHRQNMTLSCGSISFGEVIEKDDEKVLESTKRSYQEVLDGEFLLNPLNLNYDLKSLRIALSKINVVVSAGYIVLKEKTDINRQYFKYLLHRFDVAHMKLMGAGVRQTINYGHIANSLLLLPSSKEQEAIAKFLDEKTAQIDEAIGIKQQQIALLKERKQIIIQNAVTKGLNAGAPMKDSGVDWIGGIPAHWECSAVKRFLSMPITDGPHTTPELVDTGVPFISAEAIKDGQIDFNKKRGDINKKDHDDFCKKYRPKKGDVYMVKSGATTGNVAIVETDQEFSIWSPLAVFRSNDDALSNLYLYMTLQSSYFFKGVELNWSFGTQQNIGMGILGNLPITVPPKTEQMEIYKHIKDQLIGLNEVIRLQQAQINKLKEYKASLINSAVTGKVKVI